MNGGKDIKIGHDKRPVSVVPSDEQLLYNIGNGQILTDEFGNPLVTKVDQFFLLDATAERSTSIVFPSEPTHKYPRTLITQTGATTATYGLDLDVPIVVVSTTKKIPVLKATGSTPTKLVTNTVRLRDLDENGNPILINLSGYPNQVDVRVVNPLSTNNKNNLYFPEDKLDEIANVFVGNRAFGFNIPDGSFVLNKKYDKIIISENITTGIRTDKVTFSDSNPAAILTADNVLKVAEQFAETSEVSTTLLGIPRAETQLSLFSNVSSYGLNKDEWEDATFNEGTSFTSWNERANRIYGKRYLSKIEEETQESAIRMSGFPPSYSYPFNSEFAKANLYDSGKFQQYLNFILLGNELYDMYTEKGYPANWTEKFLNKKHVKLNDAKNDVIYLQLEDQTAGDKFAFAFARIDDWTDTWRDIGTGNLLVDPVLNVTLNFGVLKDQLSNAGKISNVSDGTNTRPGYNVTEQRFSSIQSRRVFRYQPGRISGFTFGLRSSNEVTSGVALEWGVANKTDQYMFKIFSGQLSIIRRSEVALETSVLIRNGLDPVIDPPIKINDDTYNTVQPFIASGDPYDIEDNEQSPNFGNPRKFHTIEIPRDKFNGDALNGNGPSGYSIIPENVTMWKIEFGWYGAIGARFYAYIPAGAGEARWVVIHTLVIENSLQQPCLRDSYFRFKYSSNIYNTATLKQPQFLYKYGASYYIDGGDEGTSRIFSASTGLKPKQINKTSETALLAVRPKEFITNSTGDNISNRKLIIPTKANVSSNALTEVKVRVCRACPGYGHVLTPGVKTTISGREMEIRFIGGNTITAVGADSFFTQADVGAKLIAPSIFNAYITEIDTATDNEIGGSYSGPQRYNSAKIYGWGAGQDGYPDYNKSLGITGRPIGGSKVIDYGQSSIETIIPVTTSEVQVNYPHKVRFSNYDVHFASDFKLSGSEIDIQFLNPLSKDQSSYGGSNTHFADFLIGITDVRPRINASNELEGFNSQDGVQWLDYTNSRSGDIGVGNTSILPNKHILFGESTNAWASMNENGYEVAESFAGRERCRMDVNSTIPIVSSSDPAGVCSLIKLKVLPETIIASLVYMLYNKNPVTEEEDSNYVGKYFLKFEGTFGGNITDWIDGQVVYQENGNPITTSLALYKSLPETYTDNSSGESKVFSYIEISTNVRAGQTESDSNLILLAKPVQLKTTRMGRDSTKVKLFKYSVFPLYLVGKLKDNAKINNISIKEKNGAFQRTTSPKLALTKNSNGSVELNNNKTQNDSSPPTNFQSKERLSSAQIDTQNTQVLRESVTKDIFYVGENSTKVVDMSKIFGVDRNVITPDNQNIEATFLTAKQLSDGNDKFVQISLNYKEQ